MLVEMAIGDAYGAAFEYADSRFIDRYHDLSRYVQHPKHAIAPGSYTDDTQMSLAITEAILSDQPWTPQLLAGKFVEAFKRDPRQGYAAGFYAFLQRVRDGEQFLREIRPTSTKSGAAMRAAPIGIYPTLDLVKERCRVQAALTHNTPEGINAALAVSLMAHYFLYKLGPKQALGLFLEQQVEGNWATPWHGKVGSQGWMSVRAAITALTSSQQLSEVLWRCIRFSGDVDTVAAMALAAGSCSDELAQDLPTVLLETLEDGLYGRTYLQKLDRQLLARLSPHP